MLKSLEILNLWGNELTEIPESLAQLENLKILDLNFTSIEVIPDFLKSLERKGLVVYK